MRRGVNMTYILENNGVYGLTKGQFSATADKGSKAKKGATNKDAAVDTVSLALLWAPPSSRAASAATSTSSSRSIKAAIAHQGAAFIDVISPCVAFNNHAGSTKSYDYVREHNEAVNRLDFWPTREAITVDYAEGDVIEVPPARRQHHQLRKLAADYDPTDKVNAITPSPAPPRRARSSPAFSTSHPTPKTFTLTSTPTRQPFNKLGEKDLCPGSAMLDKINAALR